MKKLFSAILLLLSLSGYSQMTKTDVVTFMNSVDSVHYGELILFNTYKWNVNDGVSVSYEMFKLSEVSYTFGESSMTVINKDFYGNVSMDLIPYAAITHIESYFENNKRYIRISLVK